MHTPSAGKRGPAAAAKHEEAEGEWEQKGDEGDEEGGWQELLWNTLSSAVPPTRFACSGKLSQPPPAPLPAYPDITVAGVGRLALPLTQQQADSLKAVAEQAPHGRGQSTVVDTAVRDAYQVGMKGVLAGAADCLN